MAWLSTTQLETELELLNQKGTLYDAISPDARRGYLNRASARMEDFPWQTELSYTDGLDSSSNAIPNRLKSAVVSLYVYYAEDPLAERTRQFLSLEHILHPGLADVPLKVQNAIWPYLSVEFKAQFDRITLDGGNYELTEVEEVEDTGDNIVPVVRKEL